MNIHGVIFDLDGVITDSARFHYKAWKRLADELEIYFDEEINERLKGIDRLGSFEIILERSREKYTEEEKLKLADRKNEYYKELINTMSPEDLLPGAINTLKDLKEKGLKTGLASVSKNAFSVIARLKIGEYFDYIADAAKIKKGKPDPEIFLTVAHNLGLKPENCIGVEDAEAGVKAIKSAGMYAVGIGDSKILYGADDVIPGLDSFDINKYVDVY